jgi:predicted acetyltransferase
LAELFDEYLAELSLHREISVGAVSAATYPYWDAYWAEPRRFPFVVHHAHVAVGFALIRERTAPEHPGIELAEFYVRPAYRRRGIGRAVLQQICRRHPGDWELQVHARNHDALRFWVTSIEVITGSNSSAPRCERARRSPDSAQLSRRIQERGLSDFPKARSSDDSHDA